MLCRRNLQTLLKISLRNMCTEVTIPQDATDVVLSAELAVTRRRMNEETFSSICLTSIKRFLVSNNCPVSDGFTCLVTHCINCDHKNGGTIYINKKTGLFLCIDCHKVGEWNSFEDRLKPSTKNMPQNIDIVTSLRKFSNHDNSVNEYNHKWDNLKLKCRLFTSLSPEEQKTVLSLLKLNVPSENRIFEQLQPMYDVDRKILYFPLTIDGRRVVGIKKLDSRGMESCNPSKNCRGIIRYIPIRVTRKCDQVILVHNINDLISLSAQKLNYHVICLPHGISALPQEILPLLEQYKKIMLWFVSDKLNLRAANTFAKKLNENRCYLVRKTNLSDKNEEKYDITQILNSAQHMVHENVITFSNLKQDVYLGLTNLDMSEGIKWKRFPELNKILLGHRRGELTVMTGPTGSGKTTFLSEYSLDLAMQGVITLWGSFEIRNQRLARIMLQQYALQPLQDNFHKFDNWSEEFMELPIYFLKFHGQQPIETVMQVVEQATYVYDVQHLIIDNLQFMVGLSEHEDRNIDRFYKQDKVIARFRRFATMRDCHVTLIIHPRKEKDTEELMISSIFGGAKASQEADNIIILQKKMLESLRIKKYIQIVKNRYSGDLGVMPLRFDKPTLSFGFRNLQGDVVTK